jgi:CRP/FNR family transcriptional regulator
MLALDIRHRLLQHYPMLHELPATELDTLLATVRLATFPAGAIIFDEQQQCLGFPLILSGCLRVFKSSANGRELQLYRVVAGESCILTSSCLLGHNAYQACGVVEEPLEMIVLTAPVFHGLLNQSDAFRRYVFQLFTERLTNMMELITAVAFYKLDQRLAKFLIERPGPLLVTHQVIADELGSAREIISRLLKGFAEQGWVKLGREQIILTNPAALKKFAAL